ncbi:hypothetical protein KR51_00009310 [Rubidibacter lacunae KORDI 51-2]|uniref:Uncharacterized protein n=1 Tax=Rubidibacter lacunae KORDI 51-2 TaxID=582515 RepID=U5DD10_9CHRO|nr:hypothetical protein KR51_00009310 [Rubidibacter lacunae KORDI 51-2]
MQALSRAAPTDRSAVPVFQGTGVKSQVRSGSIPTDGELQWGVMPLDEVTALGKVR